MKLHAVSGGVHRRVDVVNETAILGDMPQAALKSRTGPT